MTTELWAIYGTDAQGIVGIDKDKDMAWLKASRVLFGEELAGGEELIKIMQVEHGEFPSIHPRNYATPGPKPYQPRSIPGRVLPIPPHLPTG